MLYGLHDSNAEDLEQGGNVLPYAVLQSRRNRIAILQDHLRGSHDMTKDELHKLANLARLNIDDDALDEVGTAISNVLTLVDQLQAADTDGVRPMAHPLDVHQTLRADEINEENERDTLLALAPQAERGLFLVPKVID